MTETGTEQADDEATAVRIKIWGARGSVPAPGPEMVRYGGNTSCVQVTLSDGTMLILDAGTGIRSLGLALAGEAKRLHILLTHLHLDHIQGLVFFSPFFRPQSEILIWGPAAAEASLEDRIARYISAPLSPVEVRELPCDVEFLDAPATEWEIGPARIRAESVTHRGPTLGYRITEGETSLCYIPDHEPALGAPLDQLEPDWISGFDLAKGASLLIHDCQYTDTEYPDHIGWGHSALSDALTFARRVEPDRLLLFHHDPLHSDDQLDALFGAAIGRWEEMGGDPERIEIAAERREMVLAEKRLTAVGIGQVGNQPSRDGDDAGEMVEGVEAHPRGRL
jgi:phosphoribosyl 1,2-cyclic phosphodiesterase